jgi:hypothetical protein
LVDFVIDDDEITISFDVVSLFTAIPVDRVCEHSRNKRSKDNALGQRSKLSIDDIIKLLRFTLSNNYFKRHVQSNSRLMGSPVSPIVANLCVEKIEERAFNQTDTPPKKWFRFAFVDDVFSIIKKHAITNFHNLLMNAIDPHINYFSIEKEQNGQLSFLDTIVTRNNADLSSLKINVHRKPTHTDRYLDYNSHHDKQVKQHKISTARTAHASP